MLIFDFLQHMKALFALFAFLMITGMFYGCKKCSHCVERDASGTVVYDYGEFCGKKEEVRSYEEQVRGIVDQGNTTDCSN